MTSRTWVNVRSALEENSYVASALLSFFSIFLLVDPTHDKSCFFYVAPEPRDHGTQQATITSARRNARKRSAAPSGARRARLTLQIPVSFFQILKFQILKF